MKRNRKDEFVNVIVIVWNARYHSIDFGIAKKMHEFYVQLGLAIPIEPQLMFQSLNCSLLSQVNRLVCHCITLCGLLHASVLPKVEPQKRKKKKRKTHWTINRPTRKIIINLFLAMVLLFVCLFSVWMWHVRRTE